jgi:DNA mismatch repair ATPase MutL
LPVRLQYLQTNAHKIPREIKSLVQKYYLAHYDIRFDFLNVDQTGSSTESLYVPQSSLKNALIQVFGVETVHCLQKFEMKSPGYLLECWFPTGNDQKAWNSNPNYCIYVNRRPINLKSHKLLSDFVRSIQNHFESKKYPMVILKLAVPPEECDCKEN